MWQCIIDWPAILPALVPTLKAFTVLSLLKISSLIILIGSGKGIASVRTINQINWKRKEFKIYNQLLKHYNSAINNCPKYK